MAAGLRAPARRRGADAAPWWRTARRRPRRQRAVDRVRHSGRRRGSVGNDGTRSGDFRGRAVPRAARQRELTGDDDRLRRVGITRVSRYGTLWARLRTRGRVRDHRRLAHSRSSWLDRFARRVLPRAEGHTRGRHERRRGSVSGRVCDRRRDPLDSPAHRPLHDSPRRDRRAPPRSPRRATLERRDLTRRFEARLCPRSWAWQDALRRPARWLSTARRRRRRRRRRR